MCITNPLIYIFTTIAVTLLKNKVLIYVPNLLIFESLQTVSNYKPKLPSSPAKILALYDTYQQNGPNMINMVSQLLNYNFTTKSEIDEVIAELKMSDDVSTGLISRFWRFVTFVNFVWLVSIIGMVITFFPAFSTLFGPILIILAEVIITILAQIYAYKYEIGYSILSLLLTQSLHTHKDIGFYLALASLVGYYGLFLSDVSANKNTGISPDMVNVFIHGMMMIPTFLLTFAYESQLLGFVSVALGYSMLGFSTISSGLCWCIGFNNKNSLNNCAATSLILLPAYFALNKRSISGTKYFYYGVYIFGLVVYMIAMLISSSRFVADKQEFAVKQLMMIFSVGFAMITGSYYDITSLYNVGATFACLYFSDKIGESHIWSNNTVVLLFFTFASCFGASLWLNTHPDFLMSIIKG